MIILQLKKYYLVLLLYKFPPQPGMPPLPPGALGGALEQIKAAGSAPHLNPAFLQEMAAQNAQLGQGNMQKMVSDFRVSADVHVHL